MISLTAAALAATETAPGSEHSASTLVTVLAVGVFVGTYVVIATEWVHRVAAALGGAALMVVIGATDANTAFFAEETAIDWNVIFLLLGMMIIVGILKQTGLFEYLAIWAAKRARGRPFAILVMLCTITAVASALLPNVTTVMLVAPVTLLVCDRLRVRPEGFLIALVMASNIGGTATLIGDPPNLIIASRADLSFNDFLINLAPFIVVAFLAFVLLPAGCSAGRSHMTPNAPRPSCGSTSGARSATLRCCGAAWPCSRWSCSASSSTRRWASNPAWSQCWAPDCWSWCRGPRPPNTSRRSSGRRSSSSWGCSSWSAHSSTSGSSTRLGEAAIDAVGDNYLLAATGLLFGSAALSAIVDNIPYVATVAPLVNDLVDAAGGAAGAQALWWALALGADLGGNATAVGASANVVALGIAERNGYPISFWRFTGTGSSSPP